MADLKVSYQELSGKSKEMAGHKESFDNMIKQAQNTINGLSEAWDSSAQKQFKEKFDGLSSLFKNFSDMLGDYSKFLEDSSVHYRTADEAVQRAVKGF